jgi:hypothetical protein
MADDKIEPGKAPAYKHAWTKEYASFLVAFRPHGGVLRPVVG